MVQNASPPIALKVTSESPSRDSEGNKGQRLFRESSGRAPTTQYYTGPLNSIELY